MVLLLLLMMMMMMIVLIGLVKNGTENYIGKIPGKIRMTELQKIVLLGTAHILKRGLKYSSILITALSSWIELSTISEKSKTLRIIIIIIQLMFLGIYVLSPLQGSF